MKRLSPRARKWLWWSAAGFLLYSLSGFFLLPPIIKWRMVKQLPAITHRMAAVQQVKVNPWTLSLTVRGLALTELDGRPFASWEEFYVDFQASSLFRWAWNFKEIRLVKPFGDLILLPDGRLNVVNMLESPPKPRRTLLRRFLDRFWPDTSATAKAVRRLPKADRQALGLATSDLMADLLAREVPVTDDELLQLMAARARWVQEWLAQNGQLAAERVFLVAPKPVDANYRGECRVNLSLN